jgi:hypothetical protein
MGKNPLHAKRKYREEHELYSTKNESIKCMYDDDSYALKSHVAWKVLTHTNVVIVSLGMIHRQAMPTRSRRSDKSGSNDRRNHEYIWPTSLLPPSNNSNNNPTRL